MGVEAGGAGERGDALAHEEHGERAADDACNGGGREHDRDGEDAVAHSAVAGPPAGGAAKVTYKRASVSTWLDAAQHRGTHVRANACRVRPRAEGCGCLSQVPVGLVEAARRGGNDATRRTSQCMGAGQCMSDHRVTWVAALAPAVLKDRAVCLKWARDLPM